MSKNNKMMSSDFYCTKCGKAGIPVVRVPGKERQGGHLKKLYCIHCKEETNHVEIRSKGSYSLEQFQKEFELGRYKDGQKIPDGELMYCSNVKCEYNVQKRCWNSNRSFDCPHRPKEI